jgi:hypothetical protein
MSRRNPERIYRAKRAGIFARLTQNAPATAQDGLRKVDD